MDGNTNRPRAVAYAPVLSGIISATQYLTGDFHKSEVLPIASTPLVVKAEKIYRNTTKIKTERSH